MLMYLLNCAHCQVPTPVSPAQAGDELVCASCGKPVLVPKLGELKRLPMTESPSTKAAPPEEMSSAGRTTGFVIFGGLATLCLLATAFCGIRWALISVPSDTQTHIEEMRQAYKVAASAQLVREWEEMEKYGVDIVSPYKYQRIANEKRRWGINTAVAGSLGGLFILAAGALARGGRKPEPSIDA